MSDGQGATRAEGQLQTVRPGVHVYVGHGGMPNAVAIEGTDAVLIVDTLFTVRHARHMTALLREMTPAPVIAIVNTHFHGDHVLGNTAFDVERIIGHEYTLRHLTSSGPQYMELLRGIRPDLSPEWGPDPIRLPTETVRDRMALDVGGMTVELVHYGRTAHTSGDLVVRLPDEGVLVASDLVFNGIVPVMRDGDLTGLLATLDDLALDQSYDLVVPGHGHVGSRALVDVQRDFTAGLLEICRESLDSGGAEQRTVDAALAAFGHLMFAEERLPTGIQRTVEQLRGT